MDSTKNLTMGMLRDKYGDAESKEGAFSWD